MAPKAADAKHNSQAANQEAGQLKKAASGKKPNPSEPKATDKTVKKASEGTAGKGTAEKSKEAGGTAVKEYDELEYIEKLPEDDLEEALSRKEKADVDEKPQRISMRLVAVRALGEERVAEMGAEAIAEAVLKLQSVQLDAQNLVEIDNLEGLGNVTHLYLQRNRISRIENLESLMTLNLLSLASNCIEKVENLSGLPNLKALDLGYNKIEAVDPSDFPLTLMFLTTDGNPLSQMDDDKWSDVYDYLPELRQHDCEDIGIVESEDEEAAVRDDAIDDATLNEEESTEVTRMLLEKIMMGREQLLAASKMFDDSMEELREKRRNMVQKHVEEMQKEREEQEKRYGEAEKAVQEMREKLQELPQSASQLYGKTVEESSVRAADMVKNQDMIAEEAGAKEDIDGPD